MNLPTIIVLGVVAAVFIAVVINEIRKKRQGKSSCSCGCSGCAFKNRCHTNKK